jgi:hypothetical protein
VHECWQSHEQTTILGEFECCVRPAGDAVSGCELSTSRR